jgi:hypothetical protein
MQVSTPRPFEPTPRPYEPTPPGMNPPSHGVPRPYEPTPTDPPYTTHPDDEAPNIHPTDPAAGRIPRRDIGATSWGQLEVNLKGVAQTGTFDLLGPLQPATVLGKGSFDDAVAGARKLLAGGEYNAFVLTEGNEGWQAGGVFLDPMAEQVLDHPEVLQGWQLTGSTYAQALVTDSFVGHFTR